MGDNVRVFSVEIRNQIWEWKITVWNIKIALRNLWLGEKKELINWEGAGREWTEHFFVHVPD